jgi:hypothetical protein
MVEAFFAPIFFVVVVVVIGIAVAVTRMRRRASSAGAPRESHVTPVDDSETQRRRKTG